MIPSRICMYAEIYRYNDPNTSAKQPCRSHPQGFQEEEAKRLESK
jgi:hypothetical protein